MENMSPITNLVLNQLGTKICLQVWKGGHFLSPTMKLNGDIAFSQMVLHMDHIDLILMLTQHVQDMIRARGVISQTFKHL